MEGKENYIGDEWVYGACVTYTFEKIREIAMHKGLDCKKIPWYHPEQQWILLYHQEALFPLSVFEQNSNYQKLINTIDELKIYKKHYLIIKRHPLIKPFIWLRKLLKKQNIL